MTKNSSWRPAALSLTVLGVVARLAPHPPNFSTLGASSMFAGARLPGWQAYLVPMVLMAVTDPILTRTVYHQIGPAQLFVYASFLLAVWLGRHLRATESIPRIAALSVINSMQFFLLTNFGTWLFSTTYPQTLRGLTNCYMLAIPFFGRTLGSDLLFTGVFFGLHSWLSRTLTRQERVTASA